jgi:hypothetical protein
MQEIQFKCLIDSGSGREWTGTLKLLSSKAPYEAVVKTHSWQYYMIYGKSSNGYYIAMPEKHLSCPMDEYREIHSNKRHLYDAGLDDIDSEIIARAVGQLRKALDLLLAKDKR